MADIEYDEFVDITDNTKADLEAFAKVFADMYSGVSTVSCSDASLGMNRFDADGKTYVHLLNYDYDTEKDAVIPAKNVEVTLKDIAGTNIKVYTLNGEADGFEVIKNSDSVTVKLKEVSVYTVITAE